MSSPEPGAVAPPGGSPVAAAPAAPPTRIPPPNLNPTSPAGSGERVKVVNTEGQGANMRAEPSPSGTLVRTVQEGTELDAIGAEREGGGRQWRNVRVPDGGATGWIVSELLEPIAPPAPPAGAPKPGGEPKPEGAPKPAGEAKPDGASKPAGAPKPAASPPAGLPEGAAKPATRIDDEDRAYLSVLLEQIDVLGKAIASANEQIERTGGRPDMVNDPTWQRDTRTVAGTLRDAATKMRAATPGPNTAEVHRFARNAADRASEVAEGLTAAIDTKDARVLNGVRTDLVRVLAEINNMNLTLLDLQ